MTEQKKKSPAATRRETRAGNTLYRVTSVYLGEKDLKTALEHLAVKRALAEMNGTQTRA